MILTLPARGYAVELRNQPGHFELGPDQTVILLFRDPTGREMLRVDSVEMTVTPVGRPGEVDTLRVHSYPQQGLHLVGTDFDSPGRWRISLRPDTREPLVFTTNIAH